jgi:WD40 repeat protein
MAYRSHSLRFHRHLLVATAALLLVSCSGIHSHRDKEPSVLGGTDSITPNHRAETLRLKTAPEATHLEKALNNGSRQKAKDMVLSANGRYMLARYGSSYSEGEEEILVWDLADMRAVYSNFVEAGNAVAISSDGSKLAIAQMDGTATLTDLRQTGGAPRVLNDPCTSYISKIAFSPDGRRLVFACDEAITSEIDTGSYSAINTNVEFGPDHTTTPIGIGSNNDIGFASDSTTVVAAAARVGIGKSTPKSPSMRLIPCPACGDLNTNVFVSADGHSVSFISETAAWIWDIDREQQVTHLSSRQFLNYSTLLKLPNNMWVSFGYSQSKKSTNNDLMEIFSVDGRSLSITSVSSVFSGQVVSAAVMTPGGLLIAIASARDGDPGAFRVLRFS